MVDDYNKSDFILLRFVVKIRSSPRFERYCKMDNLFYEFPIVAPLMITPYTYYKLLKHENSTRHTRILVVCFGYLQVMKLDISEKAWYGNV